MPHAVRLYVSAPLFAGARVMTSAGQAHYLAHVMRRGVGAAVRLFNGRDGEWQARIDALERGAARLLVAEQLRAQEPEPDVWLLFAPLKRAANELVVEKATELGIARLLPVATAFTQTERLNLDRLRAIATEAAEQSERLSVPEIAPIRPLAAVLENWPQTRRLIAFAERLPAPPLSAKPSEPLALLIGPEGGFAAAELDGLRRHPFVHLASLGSRILRAETAAIVGVALLTLPFPSL
jgi:16S rRNA (uracil1498-N3)-methyltransferase